MDSRTTNTPFDTTESAARAALGGASDSDVDADRWSGESDQGAPLLEPCAWPDWQTLPESTRDAHDESNLSLDASPVALRIVVGTSSSGGSTANLGAAGQLLVLNQAADAPVEIRRGDRVVARGHLRSYDGRYCVQITEVLTRVDESRSPELVGAKE